MDQRQHKTSKGSTPSADRASSSHSESLSYAVELWNAERDEVERVVARALNAAVARAIFKAAQTEYPGRRLTLSRGRRVIARAD